MTQIFKWYLVFVFVFVGLTNISSGQTCTVPQLSIQTYPTGQIVGVYCNAPCQTYRIVEYGPVGFTPGTDSSANLFCRSEMWGCKTCIQNSSVKLKNSDKNLLAFVH